MEVKESTRNKLLGVYKTYGKDIALEVARRALSGKYSGSGVEFKTSFNGEICETVLEILVRDYCACHADRAKAWCWGKGMILKDPNKLNAEFLTELDFTLFTPECIYLFECKSYSGEKVLQGDGVLIRKGHEPFDVYRQSILHLETLDKWVGRTSRNPVYQIVLFTFSNGQVIDNRSRESRNKFPCVNESNWSTVIKNGRQVWDMRYLWHVVEILTKSSRKLREKHLEYVKGLMH